MTGPLFFTLHPHRRRARLLLPFTAAILVGQLACTSDQPTEPTANIKAQPLVATSGPHPRAKLSPSRAMASARVMTFKPSVSSSKGVAFSSSGPNVLLLADSSSSDTYRVASTDALIASLTAAGAQVTVVAPEYAWDGTNPSLNGFDVVVHLNGSTYMNPLLAVAQQALSDFVQNGGGFVSSQWDGYEVQDNMADLVLLGVGFDPNGPEHNCSNCAVTYERLPAGDGHPVLEGLPASFSLAADGHDAGPAKDFATVLMQVPSGGPAVLVRQFGSGRVVNFSFAANYPYDDGGLPHDLLTLQDPNVQHLYVNAVNWAKGSGVVVTVPQTITFEPIGDKNYGDAPFEVTASASSGLPVSFTASGGCSVSGSTATIFEAGSCTITAHQPGNASYSPAEDVSHTFAISKAAASLSVESAQFIYDGSERNVTVSSSPAGLSGVFVTFTLNGAPVVGLPVNAGVYQVNATLNNPNYSAAPATGTLTIAAIDPELEWSPAPLGSGTPLGPSQLNAKAKGLGGVALSGNWKYTPVAGTQFEPGPATLAVEFEPSSVNYKKANKSVNITVSGTMNFGGFFAPVRNLPYVNVVQGGRMVPLKFTVGAYRGRRILQVNPSSMAVTCPVAAPQNQIRQTVTGLPGLRSNGYTYTYLWKTSKDWVGTCRRFVVTFTDGSSHEALFYFTKSNRPDPIRHIFGR
jgi:hypothetical protein